MLDIEKMVVMITTNPYWTESKKYSLLKNLYRKVNSTSQYTSSVLRYIENNIRAFERPEFDKIIRLL
ncbi:MAG: hypothetical protein INQ03_19890 [Candidatus Heimdallarchaeota archaeon]|nr:hypothetical protein [Candidatus Heimdallarchaeota archaeon]